MTYILTFLFIAPFIENKGSRLFLVAYPFILLLVGESRFLLDLSGRDFFYFNSYVQPLCLVISILCLTGWQRIASLGVFILFSLYNIVIYLWWGQVSLLYYDSISLGVLLLQGFIASFNEKGTTKNLAMCAIAIIIGGVTSRYA